MKRGNLPIVISRYREAGLIYEQAAFVTLLGGGKVKSVYEKQVAMVRMSVTNTDPTERRCARWWA